MINRLRFHLAVILAAMVALVGVIAGVAPVHAAGLFDGSVDQACNGVNVPADESQATGCTSSNDQSGRVTSILTTVLNILSFVVGVVAVIMIIIGGIRFVTSQGESSSTALARNTIIYATVGLVIAVVAQVLVHFVIGRVSK